MKKHIFLIGMMGCGKSTLGKLLADRLGVDFEDLDETIVQEQGMSIPEIFEKGGDAGFRPCETQALRHVIGKAPKIVATGGGIITREENIALMRENGLVIWLNRPMEDMIAGVRQDTRPNLAGDKEERMRTLFAAREALYSRCAHVVFVNRGSVQASLTQLEELPQLKAIRC